jgi:hypothetical protein
MERAVANGSPASTTALSVGNGPLLTTTLSFLSSRAKPSDCSSTDPSWKCFDASNPTAEGRPNDVQPSVAGLN